MKSLQKSWFLVVAMLLAGSATMARHDNLSNLEIRVDGSQVVIEWTVYDATVIAGYNLERRMRSNNSGFQSLNNSCTNSGNHYTCEDLHLYKESSDETAAMDQVDYRLNVTHTDDSEHIYFEEAVQYTTNAVRRTWGRIKSMFQ